MSVISYVRRYPSAGLLAVQLAGLLLYPWMETSAQGRALFGAFGLLVLGLALWVVRRTPWLTWVAMLLALPVIVLAVISQFAPSPGLTVAIAALEAAFYFYAAGSLISYMLQDWRRDVHRAGGLAAHRPDCRDASRSFTRAEGCMRRLPCILGLTLLGACSRGDIGSTVITRDSAGVQITENIRPLWDTTAQWRVADTPSVSIGTAEGPVEYQFAQIVGATRLDDSTIAVADAATNSIRFFSAGGALIRTVGRAGNGPGEFSAMQSLKRYGSDSLEVLDRRMQRITVMDASGKVLRIVQLPRRSVAIYRLTEGRWLSSEEDGFFGGTVREDATPGLHRFPATVVVVDSTGALVDTAGVFPGAEMAYFRMNGQTGSIGAAYGRVLSLAAAAGEALVATGDYLGFDIYTSDGRHVRSVRARGPDRTLRPSDIARYNSAFLAQITDTAARAIFARSLEVAAKPAEKAAATRILVDPVGNVWLSAYENSLLLASTWYVFDNRGQYLGEIAIPSGLRILEVGTRYVLGAWKDDSGVEFVRLHELIR